VAAARATARPGAVVDDDVVAADQLP